MADGVRSKYLGSIGLRIPCKAERDKERKKVFCPLCGEAMSVIAHNIGKSVLMSEKDACVLVYASRSRGLAKYDRGR